MSDVFRRQASDPGLSRAEAQRQAMITLLDSGTNKDESGKVRFTYAHPFFWAPYSLIGHRHGLACSGFERTLAKSRRRSGRVEECVRDWELIPSLDQA